MPDYEPNDGVTRMMMMATAFQRGLHWEALTTLSAGSLCVSDEVADAEEEEASRFAAQDTLSLIGEIARDVQPKRAAAETSDNEKLEKGLGWYFI